MVPIVCVFKHNCVRAHKILRQAPRRWPPPFRYLTPELGGGWFVEVSFPSRPISSGLLIPRERMSGTRPIRWRSTSASPTRVKRSRLTGLPLGAMIESPSLFAFDSSPRPIVSFSGDGQPFCHGWSVGLAVTITVWQVAVTVAVVLIGGWTTHLPCPRRVFMPA